MIQCRSDEGAQPMNVLKLFTKPVGCLDNRKVEGHLGTLFSQSKHTSRISAGRVSVGMLYQPYTCM